MFKKVLIAEDHQSSSFSVQKTLQDLNITKAEYVYYCDHAITWLKNALRNDEPYDVLITDLSFEDDHQAQIITNGTDLIREARVIQPDLKIIVFSVENRPSIIDNLFREQGINGYVRKARHDADHLKEALQVVYDNKFYQPADVRQSIRDKNSYTFTIVDIAIVSLLYQGELQKNIPEHLKRRNIKPSSLSSVEKRLNLMKEALGFTKNEQLAVYCKEKGLI